MPPPMETDKPRQGLLETALFHGENASTVQLPNAPRSKTRVRTSESVQNWGHLWFSSGVIEVCPCLSMSLPLGPCQLASLP